MAFPRTQVRITFTIDMKKSDTVSGDFFAAIAGKDVDLVFDMGGGMSWTVNARSIPKNTDLATIDLGVSTGTSIIPAAVRSLNGSLFEKQLHIDHNGDFAFKLALDVALDKTYAGKIANLFYFNPNTEALEFRSAAKIAADGKASFAFTHASDYLIVVAEGSMEPDEPPTWQNPFADVSGYDWFYGDVQYAIENGLFTGTSDTTFAPNAPPHPAGSRGDSGALHAVQKAQLCRDAGIPQLHRRSANRRLRQERDPAHE